MLVMLTPSLACAAFVHAAADGQAQTEQNVPCHDKKSDSGEDIPLMSFKDCSGVDLAQADHNTTVKKPDVQIDKVFFAWADIVPEHSFSPTDAHQIRGPPFDASPPHFNNHDLYLTTQRLRI